MFNLPIFKQDLNINGKRILIMFSIQMVSVLLAVAIAEMNLVQISDIFWDTIPIIILPMFLEMILSYQVITKRVEDGTMDFILATGISPDETLLCKGIFVTVMGWLMILLVTVIGAITDVYRLAGYWNLNSFLHLNFGAVCLQFFISGFCFYISCRSRSVLAYVRLAFVVPVLMYVIYLGYYLVDQLFFLQYFTVFSLFRQLWFAKGSIGSYIGMIFFVLGGAAFFYLGRTAFYSQVLNYE